MTHIQNNNLPNLIIIAFKPFYTLVMHLKIDTKQKIKYLRSYLQQLKTSPQTMALITINPSQCGLYDFDYITRKRKTIPEIEKDLKDNKYQNIHEICQDVKIWYQGISEYLLMEDPLQEKLTKLKVAVSQFQVKFGEDFKENRLGKIDGMTGGAAKAAKKQQPSQPPKSKQQPQPQPQQPAPEITKPSQEYYRKSTPLQRVQMFFYLKSHQDNFQYIKHIGESYGIGKEDDANYVIRLENNANYNPWLELILKREI